MVSCSCCLISKAGALLKGNKLAIFLLFKEAVFESDSAVLISSVNDPFRPLHWEVDAVIQSIRWLRNLFFQVLSCLL